MSLQPIAVVKKFYAALAAGDVPGVIDALDDDLRWTEAEGFPYFSGTWRKPQEVVDKLLGPLMLDWESFSATADEFIVDGQRVVSFGAYSGKAAATGKTMRAPFVHVWQVRGDKISYFNMYTDTLLVHRALTP